MSSESWNKFLSDKLASAKANGHFRELKHDPASLIDFYSNDYLGIAKSFADAEKLEKPTGGSTGSRLLSGNSPVFDELESYLAQFHQAESALLFNTGYMANLGVLSALPSRGDLVLFDELSHACIKDGIRLSLAERFPFRHNDLNDLEKKLSKSAHQRKFIVFESVYSMDGDLAPIQELVGLAEKYEAFLIVDEAHSTGLFGQRGEGLCVELGLHEKIHVRIHTFGKAIGSHGAVVLGSVALKSFLVNFSRPFIFTTAMSESQAHHIKSCYERLEKTSLKDWEKKTAFFCNVFGLTDHKSPIYPILIGDAAKAKTLSTTLANEGFNVRAILSPTVKKGSERLRICLHLFNEDNQIFQLREQLRDWV